MPGLSQLKQFNKDILSLGDEVNIRASRGERPVRIPIPRTIKDVNDSDDFIIEMPEQEAPVQEEENDNDLSDIINLTGNGSAGSDKGKDDSSSDSGNQAEMFAAPDFSSLLGSMEGGGDNGGGDDGMPDLSMFMDPPETSESEPEPEPEPEEPKPVSIEDMGLEALLGGTGFDGSEIEDAVTDGSVSSFNSDEFYSDEELEAIPAPVLPSSEKKENEAPLNVNSSDFEGIDTSIFGMPDSAPATEEPAASEPVVDTGFEMPDVGGTGSTDSTDVFDMPDIGVSDNTDDTTSFDMPDVGGSDSTDDTTSFEIPDISGTGSTDSTDVFDMPDIGGGDSTDDTTSFDMPDIGGSDSTDDTTSFEMPDISGTGSTDSTDAFDMPDIGVSDNTDDTTSFDMPDIGGGDSVDSLDLQSDSEEMPADPLAATSNDEFNTDSSSAPASAASSEIEKAMGSFDFGTFDLSTLPDCNEKSFHEPKPEFELFDFEPVVKEGAILEEEPEETEVKTNKKTADEKNAADSKGENADSTGSVDSAADSENKGDDNFLDDILSNIEDMGDLSADAGTADEKESVTDISADGDTLPSLDSSDNKGFDISDLSLDDMQLSDDVSMPSEDSGVSEASLDDLNFSLDDMDMPPDMSNSSSEESASGDDLDMSTASADGDTGSNDMSFGDMDLSLDDMGMSLNDASMPSDDLSLSSDESASVSDGDAPGNDFDMSAASSEGEDSSNDMSFGDTDLSLDDMDMSSGMDMDAGDDVFSSGIDSSSEESPASENGNDTESSGEDFNALVSGFDSLMDGIGDADEGKAAEFDVNDDISDDSSGDFDANPFEDDSFDVDTSAMEGMEFPSDGGSFDDNGFDLGNADEMSMEGEDFFIPGYSDVETAKMEKPSAASLSKTNLPTPDFSGGIEGEKLPPNTLSDEQYKDFVKNLSEYPLNVRLAFEDLIVRDELTDDAEFDLIEKVLNKVPARQLASSLEKILDVTLPVPRDFEHRTAEEYEAYKKSLQYQLRNKIIPAALIGLVIMLVAMGIFQFVKNCIYIPLKAKSLYKQGYELIQQNEYPQSEMKFNEALSYRKNKQWFFNYARGYREHRQYQRSESMYELILKVFDHDKTAGLEYANMELNDLANYERAEEIIRRDVLDYHVNDEQGILTLGDIFLEWASEKDPSKFESAREQYETLISLYGPSDTYLSRMMRYYVRTDNLASVFALKLTFDANKKLKMNSDDLTEVGGYLLDKQYGPVSPAEENLRNQIEGVRGLLVEAVAKDENNPTAWYNLSRYYINTNENQNIERTLQQTIEKYNSAKVLKARDIYRYIDSYRLLGEFFVENDDYIKAQEQYTEGLSLYTTERDNAGFAGNKQIGKLYEDLGDINYFISGEYKQALLNYQHSVELDNDSPEIRYRIGYIQYKSKKYAEALGSFMKAGTGNARHNNLMLAMANTLSLRGDDYAASGYYGNLIAALDDELANRGITFPQTSAADYTLINTYLHAANNYGVTLHRLAARTGDSSQNAEAVVQFQQSVRAWDALTRNQTSMTRLDGSNLALENIRYITHPFSDYEPAIYTDIEKTLTNQEGIK